MNIIDSVIIGNSIPSWSVDEHSVQFCFHLQLFLDRWFKYNFLLSGIDVLFSQEARIEGWYNTHLLFCEIHRHVTDFAFK